MPNNRARRSFVRQGRQRRETLWVGGTTVRTTIATASTAVIQTSLNAAALALRPFTIIRVRGVMRLETDQLANSEFQDAKWGMAVVSDQAVLIGVTAVPTPDTDNTSDLWFAYEAMLNDFKVSSAIGLLVVGSERIIDSKAMRKVEDGQDLVSVIETGPASNGVVVTTFNRVLIKLH